MTPKEKSIELVNKFLQIYEGRVPQAKQCALICVDEILESLWNVGHSSSNDEIKYWTEVKQEINNL
jgi:hypothetical protein|tara:strand:- start:194 stop:391 length:198 start_codon:yes stop_codon:yes gene_type:complete